MEARVMDANIVTDQRAAARANVKSRAMMEIKVSLMDQVFMVSGTLMLKYSFTSQKPPSLTWEKMAEPAPVAMVSNSGRTPGLCARMGARIPAAVVKATVADPVARRISAATSHPNSNSDTWACSATETIACETPLS